MARISSIMLSDESLLLLLERIQRSRKDGTITKTAKDLLRERIVQIQETGDPAAVQPAEPHAVSASDFR